MGDLWDMEKKRLQKLGIVQSNDVGGRKADEAKDPLDLLSPIALTQMAKVMAFGAKKYNRDNWRKGIAFTRIIGAALRHTLAYLGGENKDPETGLSHVAHLACCAMFLLEYEVTHPNLDDRYKGA